MATDLGLIIRTLISLLCLLIIARILGRRTLSELTFYDFVVGLILGNVGAAVITDQFGIREGIIALAVSTLWVLTMNMLSLKFIPARKIIEAEPLLVIDRGKILEDNLRKRYYNINDLLEMLREQGTFDPNQVEKALIESDGQLSVLKKSEYQSPAMKDLNNAGGQTPVSHLAGTEVIIDGKVIGRGLAQSGLTLQELEIQLRNLGIKRVEDVMLAMFTPEGDLYVDKKSDGLL
ncbi:MAG TPA: DUF421 domain-containing protein [Selenomonadales bacterium]|nr:DUF421 domain-containing protein [Selenomonadales bacterium]